MLINRHNLNKYILVKNVRDVMRLCVLSTSKLALTRWQQNNYLMEIIFLYFKQ